MQSNEALLVALLVVLVFLASRNRGLPGKGTFTAGAPEGAQAESVMSPYTPLAMQTGALRGARHDAFNQDHAYLSADLAKNYRNWATTPRDLAEAQRAAWFEATANGSEEAYYNPEAGSDLASGATQPGAPAPSINYQDTLVDLISDPRMRAQQANWYSEVAPKSQTSMKVDTIDEAAAVTAQKGHGLYAFRFAGSRVDQHNPLFITDQDADDYAVQTTRFAFGG